MSKLATVTLAAGKGTRMKSELPKVLHQVAGKSMVQHAVDTAKKLEPIHNLVVVGYKAELVEENTEGKLDFVLQEEQLGTGHAVEQARGLLADFKGTVLVLYGDTPLLTAETLEDLVTTHRQMGAAATVLTAKREDPTGYGRIVREKEEIVRIVEEEDATAQEAEIKEINTGICCFNSELLWPALKEITLDNAQGEYYLTEVVEILARKGETVVPVLTDDTEETVGVNNKKHLARAESILRERICERHLEAGVTIVDPDNTYIDSEVEIGQDTVIHPFSFLEGDTKVGKKVTIGPQSKIVDSTIKKGVSIENSIVLGSEIGEQTTIGPYAYLRPGTITGKGVKIGRFVEIKKSEIEEGAKVPHLSYVGNAEIGAGTNVGAGTITANYDGVNKHKTIIEDNVFIGSNSTIVAPVTIGKEAVTGAGAVVTEDVEAGTTVVGVPARELENREKNNKN